MRVRAGEDGFTLIETIVVTAIVAIVAATLGTFFLAGASPAVASAGRDVSAAFDEARRTALAFDAATVVFAPAQSGTGYSARVYARAPGDAAFQARSGPGYDSAVTISETASPLGAPGFAFTIERGGTVTGYAGFVAGQTAFTSRPCPPGGAFTLQLTDARDVRTVAVPCRLGASAATPVALETAAAAFTPTPFPVATCPSNVACNIAFLGSAPAAPPCPPGYTLDTTQSGLCDAAPIPTTAPSNAAPPVAMPSATLPVSAPSATLPVTAPPAPNPTACPAGFSGSAPACAGQIIEQYNANADTFGPHISTLFADGVVCDDYGCGPGGPLDWTWACAFGARSGSNGLNGSNAPYQTENAFEASVSSMLVLAGHDAAEGDGDGIVSTGDSYCVGYPLPNSQ